MIEKHKPQELGRPLGDVTMLPVKTGDASKDGDGTSGWTVMSVFLLVLGSSWFNGQLIIQQKVSTRLPKDYSPHYSAFRTVRYISIHFDL